MKKIFKNTILIILCSIFTVLFSACTNGEKYSLSVDENIKSGIELVIGEDPVSFMFSIKNYDEKFSTQFNFSFNDNIAKVDKYEYLGEGKVQVTLSGLVGGETTMNIASYQNALSIQIPIIVTERIQSINFKEDVNPYLVKGESLTFNSDSILEFSPKYTKQKDVEYYYVDNNNLKIKIDENTISSTDDELTFKSNGEDQNIAINFNKFKVMAISAFDPLINCVFEVNLINKINMENISLINVQQNNNLSIIEDGEFKNIIPKFIRNNKDYSRYNFVLTVEQTNTNIQIHSKQNRFLPEITSIIEENGITEIHFSLQPVLTGKDELYIKITDKLIDDYYQKIICSIESIEIPSGLLLNDIPTGLEIILFSGQSIDKATTVNFSTYPAVSYENSPVLYLQFYKDMLKTEMIENVEEILGVAQNKIELDSFVDLVLNEDNKIVSEIIDGQVVISQESYLISELSVQNNQFELNEQTFKIVKSLKVGTLKKDGSLSFWSKKDDQENFYIDFVCFSNIDGFESFTIENTLKASVKKSATAFYVDSKYMDGKIYIEDDFEINVFDGLKIEPETAYVGEMKFTALTEGAESIAEIGQIEKDNVLTLQLLVKGKKTGVAKYNIKLPNGFDTEITINVVKLYKSKADLSFTLSEANPNVASVNYDENQNITELIVRKNQNKVNLLSEINASEGTYRFLDIRDQEINRLYVLASQVFDKRVGKVEYYISKIEDFKLVEVDTLQEHLFTVKSFNSLSNLVLETENTTVYEQSSLGYFEVQQEFHKAKLYIKDISEEKLQEIKPKLKWSFSKMYMSNSITTDVSGNMVNINDYGTFDLNTFTFTYSTTSTNISDELYVYVEYDEYDKNYTSFIKLDLKNFIKANEITLKNYVSKVNLDIINNTKILYLNINPQNATDKRFIYKYDLISGSYSVNFQVAEDYSYIKINYNGSGGCKGLLKLIPISQFINEQEYTYAIEIEIEVQDGTREYPILLKDANDFIDAFSTNIGLSQHYQIQEEIDFTNYNVPAFGELKGSIVGTTNRAKITGLKISNTKQNYSALFSKINKVEIDDKVVTSLENIIFEGYFDLTKLKNTNVGFICGINEGLIKNVTITILNSNIIVNADMETYVGCFCAENKGTILFEVYGANSEYFQSKETTLVNIPDGNLLYIKEETNGNLYVGGIAGVNTGEILFARKDNKSLVANKFGYSAYVNIQSNTNVAGVAGVNKGKIEGHLVGGKISFISENTNNVSYKSGLVVRNEGENSIVSNNTTRVFIRNNSYVSGLIARALNGKITNNNVEATYSNSNQLEIPLLIYKKQTLEDANDKHLSALFIEKGVNIVNEENKAYSFHSGYDVMFLDLNNNYKNNNDVYTNKEFDKQDNNLDNKFEKRTLSSQMELEQQYEYLSFYCANDKSVEITLENGKTYTHQEYLNNFNNIYSMPFVVNSSDSILKNNLIIESKNTNIVSILENGDFKINSTGFADIIIKSSLNFEFYVVARLYVSYKVDGYNLYYSSDKIEDNKLLNNSQIKLYTNQTFSLYSELYANDIYTIGNTTIPLISPENKDLYVQLCLSELVNSIEITSNNGHHVFKCGEIQGKNLVYGQIIYSNADYSKVVYSDYVDEIYSYKFYANYYKGASKINIIQDKVSVYPSQNISVMASVISDDDNEDIALEIYNDNGLVTDLFEISKVKNGLNFEFNIKLNDYNKFGKYTLKFIANNKLSKIIDVEILPQPITNITVNTYSKFEIDESYQDLETTEFVEPAVSTNHMTVFIDPYYADYDYIEIVNDNSNYATNSQVLFSYIGNDTNSKANYVFTNNGIRIYKQNSLNNYCNLHILKYAIGSNAVDASNTTIVLRAYKDNNVVYEVNKTLKVRSFADVTVSLSGKSSKTLNYVAKGTTQAIDINLGKYSLENAVFESSSSNVVIYPVENKIEIKKSATSGETVDIISYGTYKLNGKTIKGKESTLQLKIVDFILKNDVISAETTKMSTTLSSMLEVDNQMFEDINLIYNPSLTGVVNSVNNFKNKLKNNSVYQLKVFNEEIKQFNSIILDKSKTYNYEEFKLWYKDGWKLIPFKTMLAGKYKIEANFKLSFTNIIDVADNGGVECFIEKDIEITSNSSKETPLPIRTIDQLYAMQDNNYYILLEDLDFTKSETKFKPIKAKVAGFNGNNHKIIISSMEISELSGEDVQTTQSVEHIGLFETVSKDVLIQNVNIHIPVLATFNISKYTSGTTYLGLIAGQNDGVITNCYVTSRSGAQITANINEVGVSGTSTYVSGLVGKNEGYITNSRFECNITSNSHLAGLVGINNKHISACYVNNSEIINSSSNVNTANKTAGLVIENNGNIFESYVSGSYNALSDLYSRVKYINGKQETSSFVYLNNKNIKNCYADITTYGQGETTGFVFTNVGSIENCYSTSKLKDNSQSSFAFVKTGGNLINCYYASDLNKAIFDYKDNYKDKLIGLTLTSDINQFGEVYSEINNFAIAGSLSKQKRDFIWFYASEGNETEFNKDGSLSFNLNKPQLTSANVVISSKYVFTEITYDNFTGQEIYNYIDTENVFGSKFNPIIIDSAYAMENNFTITSSVQNGKYINNKYYRLVKDIDYDQEKLVSSKIYNSIFNGQLDGNNLSIDNYSINSNASLVSAGYFGQLGNGTLKGSIKCLKLTPKYINIPNASIVGALVGTVNYGNIVEVDVSSSELIINAKNIAGGVVGRAINTFNLINLTSNVSANATNFTNDFTSNILYNTLTDKYNNVSYAGSIAGIVAGEFGYVRNVALSNEVIAIGKIAGLMFGGILNNVTVENINLQINDKHSIKAYAYGGIIAGHLQGDLYNVAINQTVSVKDLFNCDPITPIAIGGIAGLVQNSDQVTKIDNVIMNADIISSKCSTVGGIIGHLTTDENGASGMLVNINIDAIIQGISSIGGIIGRISPYDSENNEYGEKYSANNSFTIPEKDIAFDMKNIVINANVKCDNSAVYSNYLTKYIYIGGIIGQNYSNLKFENTTTLNVENIKLNYNIKAISEKVYVYYSLGSGLGYQPTVSVNNVSIPKIKRLGEYTSDMLDELNNINPNEK